MQKIIKLYDIAKKAGINFTCVEHNSKMYRFEFNFKCEMRKRIYEDSDADISKYKKKLPLTNEENKKDDV